MQNLNMALADFYKKCGFGPDLGRRPPLTVKVYTGCMLVPLPNIETRRKYLKYHDLHHLLTGYSVGRIGEGKMSAWELGTGTFYRYPVLGFMNLIALSTGIFLQPEQMWQAFLSGKRSRNLYAKSIRESLDFEQMTIDSLSKDHIHQRDYEATFLTRLEFGMYCSVAILIHAMLVLPAILVRAVSDLIETGSVIETIKPKKRADLF
jgi:hypothetical protein